MACSGERLRPVWPARRPTGRKPKVAPRLCQGLLQEVLQLTQAIDGIEKRRLRNFAPGVVAAIEREFEAAGTLGDITIYVRKGNGT